MVRFRRLALSADTSGHSYRAALHNNGSALIDGAPAHGFAPARRWQAMQRVAARCLHRDFTLVDGINFQALEGRFDRDHSCFALAIVLVFLMPAATI